MQPTMLSYKIASRFGVECKISLVRKFRVLVCAPNVWELIGRYSTIGKEDETGDVRLFHSKISGKAYIVKYSEFDKCEIYSEVDNIKWLNKV